MLTLNKKMIGLFLISFFTQALGSLAQDPDRQPAPRERTYQGRTLDHWVEAIRERDAANMMLAFDALRSMGPDASPAVPELTHIVTAPFSPIEIGKDSDYAIATKLYDIALRSEAIDTLASIGEAAATATVPVVHWALTIRVVPARIATREEYEMFVDLVTLDVEYRIAVTNAVQRFGNPAVPILTRLLKSPDTEKRKLAGLILGPDLLTTVTDLLNSNDCDDEQLAISILVDMEPLVPKAYLAQLKQMVQCEAKLVSMDFQPQAPARYRN